MYTVTILEEYVHHLLITSLAGIRKSLSCEMMIKD